MVRPINRKGCDIVIAESVVLLSKKSQFPNANDQGNPKLQFPNLKWSIMTRSHQGHDSLGFGHWSFIGHWVLGVGHLQLRRATFYQPALNKNGSSHFKSEPEPNVFRFDRSDYGGGASAVAPGEAAPPPAAPAPPVSNCGGVDVPSTTPPVGSAGPELAPPQPTNGMANVIIASSTKPHFENRLFGNNGNTETSPSNDCAKAALTTEFD